MTRGGDPRPPGPSAACRAARALGGAWCHFCDTPVFPPGSPDFVETAIIQVTELRAPVLPFDLHGWPAVAPTRVSVVAWVHAACFEPWRKQAQEKRAAKKKKHAEGRAVLGRFR